MSEPHEELVELTSFNHEYMAQLFLDRLSEEGIDGKCFSLAGEQLGLMSASTSAHGGAQVRVPSGDLQRARELLAEFNAERASPDNDGEGDG